VSKFDVVHGSITGVRVFDDANRSGMMRADAIVLAAGSYSAGSSARWA
jgi:glycerol-3-phosphate dehydrogenase